MSSIAIIGMACRYADARSPVELWENVLAQRQAFRRIPRVRLNLPDYSSEAGNADLITPVMAAVLANYEFDRSRFHISQDAFLSADLTHWLALDVAAHALTDAKLLSLAAAQRERTSVYVGNSLTGEFSRANLMRLRWPYVRRVLAAAFQEKPACAPHDMDELLARIEALYKAPFPATNEESLAGGLSNTIAGRICNYFDFKGGGYTVDGACASSLLAVTTACSALQNGEVDIAIAGGVDLSLDPFELAGFSRLGALAGNKMRVFDAHSSGFWPGEGCGMVVLMRHEDALAQYLSPYAVIRGWGISSDGRGGITRPEVAGQMLALQRAYKKSEYGIDSVAYFEGHGTGTSIGDAVEMQALSRTLHQAASKFPAALGSIKANIGHTKAAAGVAGLIKATMAVHSRVMPPTTGCDRPHPELTSGNPALRILRAAEFWPANAPARAGVNGFGFGGINVHITLEATDTLDRKNFTAAETQQLSSAQDCELFLFAATDAVQLSAQLEEVLHWGDEISYSELSDLSVFLARKIDTAADENNNVRAACVASSPDEFVSALKALLAWCNSGIDEQLDVQNGTFLGKTANAPTTGLKIGLKIGFLFSGQASPVYTSGGIWSRRFWSLCDLYARAHLPQAQTMNTQTAQPCIVTASLAGLHVLNMFGLRAGVAVGHSLGEITALHWAGAIPEAALLGIVHARGKAMAEAGDPSGAMASIRASRAEVLAQLNGDGLVVAAQNAPLQTVVSGEARAVKRFAERMRTHGLSATMLPVSHAFHSPLVAGVAAAFFEHLSLSAFAAPQGRVISTVTGGPLDATADLGKLLREQITSPVQFAQAITLAAEEVDLFIEVGPGTVLSGIAAECTDKPVVALDAGSESLRGLFSALGAAFALGADIDIKPLFENRLGRNIDVTRKHLFLANPCETIAGSVPHRQAGPPLAGSKPQQTAVAASSALDALLGLVVRRTQLPPASIQPEHRFLQDLHLNSITISQIMLEAASQLSLSAPVAPAEFTNATLAQAAEALEALRSQGPNLPSDKHPAGVDAWIRTLGIELKIKPLRRAPLLPPGKWEVAGTEECLLLGRLRETFRSAAGDGLICLVPPALDANAAAFLLRSAQSAIQQARPSVVFVQHGDGAGALARTLYLENPNINVAVVDVPRDHPEAAAWVAAEANANRGFMEAHYDDAGIRREPRLKLMWPEPDESCRGLSPSDVLLVTGGGKGIAAECALHLARMSGCRLALLGRSDPAADTDLQNNDLANNDLKNNLQRFTNAGVSFAYFKTDITDACAVRITLESIASQMGPVTALLHGAGINDPKRLEDITHADLHKILAPKLTGLRNLLAHMVPENLRLLLTFGSIIARTGLHGEAHYGLANEWLDLTVQQWQQEHPDCRCMNLEWSVWAGIGMGQRLGVLDSLVRQGITPLPVDDAIQHLQAMLSWKNAPASAIITGRFGDLPTLRFDLPELPLLRFLEYPRTYHPGVELIADAELSADTDPYVTEHAFQGEQLLPAVMGMEAMAQAAKALEQSDLLPTFRNLRFEHPIVIPHNQPVTVRVAALRRCPGTISAVVRCSSTGFQVDHFSGECIFEKDHAAFDQPVEPRYESAALDLNPVQDLYGRILFHNGRFRRVEAYHLLHADKSVAALAPPAEAPWFARHLPAEFVLGDAASRDAALHSIQASIPHKTILPVGIDRVIPGIDWTLTGARVHATERSCHGDNFVYDISIEDADGRLCEQWEGLHLRAVAAIDDPAPWPTALLVPYLERRIKQWLPIVAMKIGLARAPKDQHKDAINNLIRELFGEAATLAHRPDGKPEIAGPLGACSHVSISHSADITLLFSTDRIAGCDLEIVAARTPECWEQLLGAEGFALAKVLSDRSSTRLDEAATQVWTLKEGLRKAGACCSQPVSLRSRSDGWATFSAGAFSAVTFHAYVAGCESALAFAFVIHNSHSLRPFIAHP